MHAHPKQSHARAPPGPTRGESSRVIHVPRPLLGNVSLASSSISSAKVTLACVFLCCVVLRSRKWLAAAAGRRMRRWGRLLGWTHSRPTNASMAGFSNRLRGGRSGVLGLPQPRPSPNHQIQCESLFFFFDAMPGAVLPGGLRPRLTPLHAKHLIEQTQAVAATALLGGPDPLTRTTS